MRRTWRQEEGRAERTRGRDGGEREDSGDPGPIIAREFADVTRPHLALNLDHHLRAHSSTASCSSTRLLKVNSLSLLLENTLDCYIIVNRLATIHPVHLS
jgi:hypothetical protein